MEAWGGAASAASAVGGVSVVVGWEGVGDPEERNAMSWNPEAEIADFVRGLSDTYGGDLASVVLHGSVARGDAQHDVSDVNLLVLVRDVSPDGLIRGSDLVRHWHESGHGAPLLFTPSEWARAIDVFPVEIADMADTRRVLYGDDPVEGRQVSLRHLRLQTERELRGRLVVLREGMVLAGGRPDELGRLLLVAAPAVAAYMRALLRLLRSEVPNDTSAVVRAAADRLDADPEPFLDVWRARRAPGSLRPTLSQTAGVFDLLLATANHVDTLGER